MADLDSAPPVPSTGYASTLPPPDPTMVASTPPEIPSSKFDRPRPPRDWRFWVGGLGRVLIATGLMMFGFVAYQLWGTGIETARAQNSLENEFTELIGSPDETATEESSTSVDSVPIDATDETSPEETPTDDTVSDAVADVEPIPADEQVLPFVEEGDAIARLEIPAIGVDKIVVAGVEKNDLKSGPGHYPETPLPGQLGNAAIAGHRTTYGQPFYDVDKLVAGDEIIATTPNGRFVYLVTSQQIVSPQDYQVVATTDPTSATLTLTSCHPRYTARQRIIITSELDQAQSAVVGEPVVNYGRPLDDTEATPAAVDDGNDGNNGNGGETSENVVDEADPLESATVDESIADAFDDGWFSDPAANVQVALWGVVLALIGLGSYLLSRTARRDWVGGLVGLLPFVVALYFFFQNVNRLLPPNL